MLTSYSERVTSTAPGLVLETSFNSRVPIVYRLSKSAHIATIGTFQDGGLKRNNPINLALWESLRIWPSITQPDVVLSLGTGTEKEAISPGAPNFRHVFQDGFVPRLYGLFISFLDDQCTWRDLQNRLDEKSRQDFFHLNVTLLKDQWTIDDISQMGELRRQVHLQQGKDKEVHDVAFALMVSSFYFELIQPPNFTRGNYRCEGYVRSRLHSASMEQVLRKGQISKWTFVTDKETLGYYEPEADSSTVCHRYEKRVEFSIRLPTDPITIYIESTPTVRREISGFPQSINWFITQQTLTAEFGTPNHGKPTHKPCEACNTQNPRSNLKSNPLMKTIFARFLPMAAKTYLQRARYLQRVNADFKVRSAYRRGKRKHLATMLMGRASSKVHKMLQNRSESYRVSDLQGSTLVLTLETRYANHVVGRSQMRSA